MRRYLCPAAMAFAFGIAASPVYADTLTADGITYSLTDSVVNSTTNQFTLTITGINGSSDTEGGRYGVQSFAFNKPANFSTRPRLLPRDSRSIRADLTQAGVMAPEISFAFRALRPLDQRSPPTRP